MANPLGITFLPSADNQAAGPQQGALEGGPGGNLAQAFKILSLRLPRVLGASAISSPRLLTSPGSAAVMGGFNPHAAVFEALLRAMTGGAPSYAGLNVPGSQDLSGGGGGAPPAPGAGGAPRIIPGDVTGGEDPRSTFNPPASPSAPAFPSASPIDRSWRGILNRTV